MIVEVPAREPVPGEHPRLDWYLDVWASWHRSREHLKRLGAGTSGYWTKVDDFDDKADRSERICAEAVEAMVRDDLTRVEQCAMDHFHLGTAVYRGNREPIEAIYARARMRLSAGLARKGMF